MEHHMRVTFFAPLVVLSGVATVYGCSGADRVPIGAGDAGGGSTAFSEAGVVDDVDGGDDTDLTCAATVVKAEPAKVDILFIVDASGSMYEELAQTQTNINAFAQSIGKSGLDYRVLMIAGDDICVPPPLGGATCASKPPTFYKVPVHVESNDALQILLDTYDNANPNSYYTAPTPWRDLVRPESVKIFVAITDDDSYVTDTAFDAQLLQKKPAGMFGTPQQRNYIFDSIVGWTPGTPTLSSQTCSTAVNTGLVYQQLSRITGGLVDSVCNTSFAGVFDNLAKGVTKRLACQLDMPADDNGEPVDPTKVQVEYKPGDGSDPRKLVQVTGPTKCKKVTDGWFYDDPDEPTQVILCPEVCDEVSSDTEAEMNVLVGCKAPGPK
jgi:hypothetical protein